jgi:DNA modification methylase
MTPYWQSEGVTLYHGDARAVLAELPAGSVQTCVTSPPYFGLRSYSGGEHEIGAEGDLDAYIANLVAVFEGVKRVLRDDGTCWVNLGDAYSGGGSYWPDAPSNRPDAAKARGAPGAQINGARIKGQSRTPMPGLKPKDLMMVPHRVAFALQAAGWYLRSAIVWEKSNCMPESVTDRPTMSYEMIFLLAKNPRYFYDAEAIKEPAAPLATTGRRERNVGGRTDGYTIAHGPVGTPATGRNKRAVWSVPTQPLKAAHFAAWPEKLVEPMILAGSSEKGQCPIPECRAPWVRETRRGGDVYTGIKENGNRYGSVAHISGAPHSAGRGAKRNFGHVASETTGWRASCPHADLDPVPQVILDPFAGSGRSGVVARKLGRHFIGIDLNSQYLDLSRVQITAVQPPRWACRRDEDHAAFTRKGRVSPADTVSPMGS